MSLWQCQRLHTGEQDGLQLVCHEEWCQLEQCGCTWPLQLCYWLSDNQDLWASLRHYLLELPPHTTGVCRWYYIIQQLDQPAQECTDHILSRISKTRPSGELGEDQIDACWCGLDPPLLHIKPNTKEFVSSFIYLGSTISNNGDLTPEINCRCSPVTKIIYFQWKPVSSTTALYHIRQSSASTMLWSSRFSSMEQKCGPSLWAGERRLMALIADLWKASRMSNGTTTFTAKNYIHQSTASHLIVIGCIHWNGYVLCLSPDHAIKALLSFSTAAASWKRASWQTLNKLLWLRKISRDSMSS